jgi:hypothetical protein
MPNQPNHVGKARSRSAERDTININHPQVVRLPTDNVKLYRSYANGITGVVVPWYASTA